jgi:hypothetical protein
MRVTRSRLYPVAVKLEERRGEERRGEERRSGRGEAEQPEAAVGGIPTYGASRQICHLQLSVYRRRASSKELIQPF